MDYINIFKEHLIKSGKSHKTVKGYSNDIRDFIEWFNNSTGEEFKPSIIYSENLQIYKQHLIAGIAAPATANRKLSALRHFFRWASETCFLKEPPRVPKEIRQETKVPTALTKEQEDAIVRVIRQAGNKRDYVIVTLMLNTGIKVHELVNLSLADIDIKSGILRVVDDGHTEREVPLNDFIKEILSDYCENLLTKPDEKIFVGTRGPIKKRLSTRSVQKIFNKYKKLAGIHDPSITVYSLRHTFTKRIGNDK